MLMGWDTKRHLIINKLKRQWCYPAVGNSLNSTVRKKMENGWREKSYFHMGPKAVEVLPLSFHIIQTIIF